MKRFLLLVIALSFLCSCSVEKQNREMHEFIRSKEHDPLLIGWWKSNGTDNQYLLFDDVDYKLIHGEMDSNMNLIKRPSYDYWYTENRRIHILRDATILTGTVDTSDAYELSEDGNAILFEKSDGTLFIGYVRIENP